MIQKKFASMHFSVTRYLRLAIITSLYLSGFKRSCRFRIVGVNLLSWVYPLHLSNVSYGRMLLRKNLLVKAF